MTVYIYNTVYNIDILNTIRYIRSKIIFQILQYSIFSRFYILGPNILLGQTSFQANLLFGVYCKRPPFIFYVIPSPGLFFLLAVTVLVVIVRFRHSNKSAFCAESYGTINIVEGTQFN